MKNILNITITGSINWKMVKFYFHDAYIGAIHFNLKLDGLNLKFVATYGIFNDLYKYLSITKNELLDMAISHLEEKNFKVNIKASKKNVIFKTLE